MGGRLREDICNIKIWQEFNIQSIRRTPENQQENDKKHSASMAKSETYTVHRKRFEMIKIKWLGLQSQ